MFRIRFYGSQKRREAYECQSERATLARTSAGSLAQRTHLAHDGQTDKTDAAEKSACQHMWQARRGERCFWRRARAWTHLPASHARRASSVDDDPARSTCSQRSVQQDSTRYSSHSTALRWLSLTGGSCCSSTTLAAGYLMRAHGSHCARRTAAQRQRGQGTHSADMSAAVRWEEMRARRWGAGDADDVVLWKAEGRREGDGRVRREGSRSVRAALSLPETVRSSARGGGCTAQVRGRRQTGTPAAAAPACRLLRASLERCTCPAAPRAAAAVAEVGQSISQRGAVPSWRLPPPPPSPPQRSSCSLRHACSISTHRALCRAAASSTFELPTSAELDAGCRRSMLLKHARHLAALSGQRNIALQGR